MKGEHIMLCLVFLGLTLLIFILSLVLLLLGRFFLTFVLVS